ncbi:hypothetical protein [Paraburkholderia bannensis]|uniref:hypothetical protein n=1 Tax=Paraburkholderia bannensis TaxID=765414 RepID=UPI002ABDBCC5|nr:hypothetical protein [Paraburkholderia bannensis]
MGDHCTFLVNTRISRAEAPEAALGIYRQLVQGGVIVPGLKENISIADQPFAIRQDYKGFDDLYRWSDEQSRRTWPDLVFHHGVNAIEIDVTGYVWHAGLNGEPDLRPVADGEYLGGLFFEMEGGFSLNCPCCGDMVSLGQGGDQDEALTDALNSWCFDPESAHLRCYACNEERSLRDWRSEDQQFAVGHLAITFWDEHLLALAQAPDLDVSRFFRELTGGTTDADPAVVFRNI